MSYLPAFSAFFSIFSHFQQLSCCKCSVQADLPQNFLTDNLTYRLLKLILKLSALSPLSAHPQPTLSPPLSHPHVTLTLFPMISLKLKMAETAAFSAIFSIFSHFQHFQPFSANFSSCLVLAVLSRLTCLKISLLITWIVGH